jgi:hypothetical protein
MLTETQWFVCAASSGGSGARVALKIAHAGIHFFPLGRVVNCVGDHSSRGLGIEFTEIDPIDKNRLEACLTELAVAHKLPPVPSA